MPASAEAPGEVVPPLIRFPSMQLFQDDKEGRGRGTLRVPPPPPSIPAPSMLRLLHHHYTRSQVPHVLGVAVADPPGRAVAHALISAAA